MDAGEHAEMSADEELAKRYSDESLSKQSDQFRLEAHKRRPVALRRFVEGATYTEISAELGVGVSAIRHDIISTIGRKMAVAGIAGFFVWHMRPKELREFFTNWLSYRALRSARLLREER